MQVLPSVMHTVALLKKCMLPKKKAKGYIPHDGKRIIVSTGLFLFRGHCTVRVLLIPILTVFPQLFIMSDTQGAGEGLHRPRWWRSQMVTPVVQQSPTAELQGEETTAELEGLAGASTSQGNGCRYGLGH